MKVGRCLAFVWVVGPAAPGGGQTSNDSDLVRLNGVDWRLHGVDFPDPRQVCLDGWRAGEAAQNAVHRLTEGAELECRNGGYAHGCETPSEWRMRHGASR